MRTLVTARQAHDLTIEEASRHYAVALKGIVTYYDWLTDPNHNFLFLHDESGSIFVRFPKFPAIPLSPGDLISVNGVSNAGNYAPIVEAAHIRRLGHVALPAAAHGSLERMVTGAEDGKWLQVRGIVLGAEALDRWRLMLDLQADIGVLRVTVINYGGLDPYKLIDSSVLVTGNCAPYFNKKYQMVGARLFVPQRASVQILKAAPDPFSLPAQSIASLRRYTPDVGDVHRRRVRGTVTLSLSDRFVIQESDDATMVEPSVSAKVSLGEQVDTVGIPTPGEYSSLMRRALFRPLGNRIPIVPAIVTPEQVLAGSYDMRLIRMEGRLVELRTGPSQQTFVIASKNSLVEGILQANSALYGEVGSYLQLTGVCAVQVDANREPKGFQLLLRSPADVVVLRSATWWSVAHTLYLFFGTLLATLVVFAWVVVLRNRVSEQTDVIRRQLDEAGKLMQKAEAASRAKSDFLANMSHEIRTPLNGVIGMTELAMCSSGAEQQEYHALIKSSGEALLVILNDILDYSKIEAGKVVLEAIPFNLEEVVGSAVKSIAHAAHKKGLELTFQVAPDAPSRVVGDPNRLRQVLLNLIGNAIKFTHAGEVAISVVEEAAGEAETSLRFSVRDSGLGISAEQQNKLFQPFEQADSSTTRRYGGTGLGLAISGRIVELMGGRIWIESGRQKGSTFHFTARFSVASPALESLARLTGGFAGGGHLVDRRVLIVDDNATSRNILKAMTAGWQMRSEAADSGEVGLRRLEQAAALGQPFHLLVLDEQMPGWNGCGFLEHMRSGPAAATAVVKLLSSAERVCVGQASSDHCLIKPVGSSELFLTLQKALGRQELAAGWSAVSPVTGLADGGLNILLAEDNPVNQKLAASMLKKMGHRVTLAQNGEEAAVKWSEQPFDLIFMDVQMPVMDGLTATRLIRSRETAGKHIAIVAITANVMSGDRELCLNAGMDDYVSKPISRRSLTDAIERISVCT